MDEDCLSIPSLDSIIEETDTFLRKVENSKSRCDNLANLLGPVLEQCTLPPQKSDKKKGGAVPAQPPKKMTALELLHASHSMTLSSMRAYHKAIQNFEKMLGERIAENDKVIEAKKKLLCELKAEKRKKEQEIHDVAKAGFEKRQKTGE